MLTIGTDCSGIEAPVEALRQLGIAFEHSWSCEKDKYAVKSIQANYTPKRIYDDIATRNHKNLQHVDIYVCGFPCQPFSLLGKKQSLLDDRSNIMFHCIEVIKATTPTVFILENVRNFKYIENGQPFAYLLNELNGITHGNSQNAYHIYTDVLNTNDYGIPHNRERVYVIGILKKFQRQPFQTPRRIKMRPLYMFMNDTRVHNVTPKKNARKVIERFNLSLSDNNVIACAGYGNYMKDMTPSITCSTPLYLTKYKRYLTAKECLQLQGFSKTFKQVVSDRQLRRQAGNAMSVNVVKSILKSIFKATNFKATC